MKKMKKSSDYWAKRKADFMVRQMEDAEQVAKTMRKAYRLVEEHLNSQAKKIFERYRKTYGLTESEARRLLEKHGANIDSILKDIHNGAQTEARTQILNDSDAAAYAHRLNELKQTQESVDWLMGKLAKNDTKTLEKHLFSTSRDAYLHSIYLTEQQAGVKLSFRDVDVDYVQNLLKTNWHKKHFSEAIWDSHEVLGQTIKEEFLVNYLTGRSTNDMAKVLSERFGVSYYNARRLARTESTFVEAEMEAKAYEEIDIEEYEYVSILDNRTSAPCRKHDDKIYKVKDRQAGVNYPPVHVFCRSTTIAHIPDDWILGDDSEPVEETRFAEWKADIEKINFSDKISNEKSKKEETELQYIDKLNKRLYGKIFDGITSDDVIITKRQIDHIRERHPGDYEKISPFFKNIINEPDFVIKGNKKEQLLF